MRSVHVAMEVVKFMQSPVFTVNTDIIAAMNVVEVVKKVVQQKNLRLTITQLKVKKMLMYAQPAAVMAHSKGLIPVQPAAQFKFWLGKNFLT